MCACRKEDTFNQIKKHRERVRIVSLLGLNKGAGLSKPIYKPNWSTNQQTFRSVPNTILLHHIHRVPHPHSGRCFASAAAAAAESEVSPNPHLSPHILPSTCLHSIRKSSPYEIGNRNGSAVSVAGSIPHALSCTQPEIVSLILFLDSVVLVRLQSVKLVHPRY